MKKFISCGSITLAAVLAVGTAHAADLKAAPAYNSVAPAYNWTGFYVGANTGVGTSQASSNFTTLPNDVFDRGGAGFSFGVQAGFNWQFAPQWVAGIEGDVSYLGIKRSFLDLAEPDFEVGVKADRYGTLRGRLGYTTGPSLLYAAGGGALVAVKNNFDQVQSGVMVIASESKAAFGWAVGGGIETMLGGSWSAKAEYLYIDAGTQDVLNPSFGANNNTFHFDNRFHIYRYGLNYKFGPPAATAAVLPSHNWSGLYVGVNAGAALSQDRVTFPTSTVFIGATDIAGSGFTGGAQGGYNWQFNSNWVTGVEGDIGWLGINRSTADFSVGFGVKTDWYGTARGRVGYSTGPALLYATGGVAFVNVKNSFDRINSPPVTASKSETATGFVVGGGIEVALTQNWTAKTEYLYIDAGSQDVVNPGIGGGLFAHFENRFHLFRYGLNYKFSG
jgi:outer membrane immunogenic protein